MEKYKLDLGELRDAICNKQTNILEISHAVPLPEHFIESQDVLLPMQRDIPAYNKYELTKETKDALKTAQFDVWAWEPNEVREENTPTPHFILSYHISCFLQPPVDFGQV